MTPNDNVLYSYINIWLIHHQRSVLVKQMRTNIEIHSSILCRQIEYIPLRQPLMGCLHHINPLRPQRNLQKRGKKKYKSQRGWRESIKQGPWNQWYRCRDELTESETACMEPSQVCPGWGPGGERIIANMSLSKSQKPSPTDNHFHMKINVFPRESYWGSKPLFRIGCMSSRRWQIEDKLNNLFSGS